MAGQQTANSKQQTANSKQQDTSNSENQFQILVISFRTLHHTVLSFYTQPPTSVVYLFTVYGFRFIVCYLLFTVCCLLFAE